MDELLATVLTVRQYVLAAVLLVGLATLATIILVFVLSARLRRNEILTMTRIGAAPGKSHGYPRDGSDPGAWRPA